MIALEVLGLGGANVGEGKAMVPPNKIGPQTAASTTAQANTPQIMMVPEWRPLFLMVMRDTEEVARRTGRRVRVRVYSSLSHARKDKAHRMHKLETPMSI
jgi:hypothetical protein